MAIDTELVHKVIGMLGSEHDGEVVAAARTLMGLAKKEKITINEMLAAVYSSPWHETTAQQATRPRPRPARSNANYDVEAMPILHILAALVRDLSNLNLNAWETDFMANMAERWEKYGPGTYVSDKQENSLRKIAIKNAEVIGYPAE